MDFQQGFKDRNLYPMVTGQHEGWPTKTGNRRSVPIDEVFMSPDLEVVLCGLTYHEIITKDHRSVWMDVTKNLCLDQRIDHFICLK